MNCFNPIVYGVSGLKEEDKLRVQKKTKLFEMKPQTEKHEDHFLKRCMNDVF